MPAHAGVRVGIRSTHAAVHRVAECGICDGRALLERLGDPEMGCRRRDESWEAYLTDEEPPELAFYCPSCAEREFGDD